MPVVVALVTEMLGQNVLNGVPQGLASDITHTNAACQVAGKR